MQQMDVKDVYVIHGCLLKISVVGTAFACIVIPKGYSPQWLLWIAIYKWSGLALLVESLVHVALHFRWPVTMTKRLVKR